MRAQVVRRGFSVGDKTIFRMESDEEPAWQDVAEAQRVAGYHPYGYGGPSGLRCERDSRGKWLTTWWCRGSCD